MSRRVIPTDDAVYIVGEPLALTAADDRVLHTDSPPPVVLTPAGPTAVPLDPAPPLADDRSAPPA